MKVKDLKKLLNEDGIDDDMEVAASTADGRGSVWTAELDGNDLVFKTDGGERLNTYRISYVLTRDHVAYMADDERVKAASDMDVVLELEDYKKKFLERAGIKGEVSEKTGSTIVEEDEDAVVSKSTGVTVVETKKVKHYYNCVIREVMQELDAEKDIYARVWKNGKIA